MLPPIALGAGVLGLGYWAFKKFGQPKASDFQTQTLTGAGGVPVKVMTPIADHVTDNQAKGVSTPPVKLPPGKITAPAVAQVVPGQGTVYAPPKMVTVTSTGSVQMAPILVTPSGSSSMAIGGVLDVQRGLNTLGIKPALKEDGRMGPATLANIKAFQRKVGLAVDGSAGAATMAAVSNALASLVNGGPTAPIGTAAVKAVAAGTPSTVNTLKDIQHALNLLGTKPPLAEDGKSGPKTVAAIKSFQLSHGVPVDGIAGPKTKAALGLAIGGGSGGAKVAGAGQFGSTFG